MTDSYTVEAIRLRDFTKPDRPYIEGAQVTSMKFNGRTYFSSDLPKPDTKRWVVRRKAEVVAAVDAGLLTLDEALERYGISMETFTIWKQKISKGGLPALRETRVQDSEVRHSASAPTTEAPEPTVAQEHPLSIEAGSRLVCFNGQRIGHFTWKETDLLEILLQRQGVAVDKTQLLNLLYKGKYEPGMKVLDVFVCKLRKKLEAYTGKKWIETMWGNGYRLSLP